MAPFELSVALKYLKPRWRQLSVSIISLISIGVIALVVWLIVVFFSVTHGLEKSWTEKLIALTAPVRITPTEAYYSSYYHKIDGVSAASGYSPKSIGEKAASLETDPYDPSIDEELPSDWPAPLLNAEGGLKDPVRIAYREIEALEGVEPDDYEITFGTVRLRLLRDMGGGVQGQSFLTQNAYLGSMDPGNEMLARTALELSPKDLSNLLQMLSVSSDNILQEEPEAVLKLEGEKAEEKLRAFFDSVEVAELKSAYPGWPLPKQLLPKNGRFEGAALLAYDGTVNGVVIPKERKGLAALMQRLQTYGRASTTAVITVREGEIAIKTPGMDPVGPPSFPLLLEEGVPLQAALVEESLRGASGAEELQFRLETRIQGERFAGTAPYKGLEISEAKLKSCPEKSPACGPFWLYREEKGGKKQFRLPSDPEMGDGVLLPRNFRDSGVLLGDRGFLSYHSPTGASVREMRVPVTVAGFFDPGIVPIGGRFVIAPKEVTEQIRAAQNSEEITFSNGINLRFSDLSRADGIKERLEKAFEREGIAYLWKVETYKEYDFTKDIIQQLRSEKNLFSLLSIIIMIVACSNIISMLIILVNDKKMEIGILRAMGAPPRSIAAIFGICGATMGLLGSALGILLAAVTLRNLETLVNFLSRLQGFEMFNPVFYGETLPSALSFEALGFVILMTAVVSTIAGVVPAIKACLLKPSEILRAE